jgi:ankyrin repeat protein
MNSQSWIVDPAIEQGFVSNKGGGICYGYAHMVSQALLAEEINTFEDRIKLIKEINSANQLKLLVEDWKGENFQLELIKVENHDVASTKIEAYDELNITDKNNQVTKIRIEPPLNLDNKDDLRILLNSIPAFYNGIELYFQSHLDQYSDLFDPNERPNYQDYKVAQDLILPLKLKEQGGAIEMSNFSGQYQNSEDIERYLCGFINLIDETKGEFPLSIVLNSGNHLVTIGYDSKKKELILAESNDPSVRRFKLNEDMEMISSLATAFKENINSDIPIMFTSRIFIRGNDVSQLQDKINDWKKFTEGYALTCINPQSSKLLDEAGFSWLNIAVRDGQADIVQQLLNNKVNPNTKKNDSTPLYIAAMHGYSEITNALLKKGAHIDEECHGFTPLSAAACNGKIKTVEVLLSGGADVNKRSSNGSTAIDVAVNGGHDKVVKALLKAGADIDEVYCNTTLLQTAAMTGEVETVKLLISNGADINYSSNNYPPILYAAELGHAEVIKELVKAGADVPSAISEAELMGESDIAEKLAIFYLVNLNNDYAASKEMFNAPRQASTFFGAQNKTTWPAKEEKIKSLASKNMESILKVVSPQLKEEILDYASNLDVFKDFGKTPQPQNTKGVK